MFNRLKWWRRRSAVSIRNLSVRVGLIVDPTPDLEPHLDPRNFNFGGMSLDDLDALERKEREQSEPTPDPRSPQ